MLGVIVNDSNSLWLCSLDLCYSYLGTCVGHDTCPGVTQLFY